MRLDGNDLVPDKLQDAVHYRLEALQNLLVCECHVTLLDTSLGELCLNADVDRPLLTVVSEVGLYPVLKVHDTFCVNFAGSLGAIRELHLPYLCAQNVTEVSVEGSRTTRVTGSCCALGHGEWLLLLDLVSNQIDGTTTAIDDQYGIMYLEVEKPSL